MIFEFVYINLGEPNFVWGEHFNVIGILPKSHSSSIEVYKRPNSHSIKYFEDEQVLNVVGDDVYSNVVYYNNDSKTTGLQLCERECDGNCIEYGYTGRATCFKK